MEETDPAGTIGQLVTLLDAHYVFPDIAAEVGQVLTDRLAAGRYAAEPNENALATVITQDMQSINGDKHLRLKYHADPIYEEHGDHEADLADLVRWARLWSGGFPRVERLPGNVGYLEVRPVLFPPAIAGNVASAAVTVLADTDALLLDLRRCVGGDPAMVTWLCSYLFDDQPVELSGIYDRRDDRTRQAWTLPHVPGPRFGTTTPIWVLTSATTFSGGEALGYDLQQIGRATVVGERTGGGAHPRRGFRLGAHLEATIPVGRPVSPLTGTNWEGTGVVPDLAVPADEAPRAAYRLALDHVLTLGADGYRRDVHDEAGEALANPASAVGR
jgi:hypothetical protein